MEKLKKPLPDLFVVGTDTDVGKTIVSLLLMHLYARQGATPFYVKPFQTGCKTPFDNDSDALFISRHSGGRFNVLPDKSTIFCFRQPKAPWFAARNQGEQVDLTGFFNTFEKLKKSGSPIIMEAAGGLMVPVNQDTLIIDLVKKTAARPILVARAGLGTINHTLLSIQALTSAGINPLGVVLSHSGVSETPKDMVLENIEAIERFSKVRVGGVIDPINDFSNPDAQSLKPLENLIFGHENR